MNAEVGVCGWCVEGQLLYLQITGGVQNLIDCCLKDCQQNAEADGG